MKTSCWMRRSITPGPTMLLPNMRPRLFQVMFDRKFIGEFTVDSTGLLLAFEEDDDSYVVGFDPITELDPLPPVISHPAYARGKRYGIPKCTVHVKDTCAFRLNGALSPSYRAGDDVEDLPPLRTESNRMGVAGRGTDLSPVITQDVPAPIEVLAITMEVSF
jgi:hypothetical protein